MLRFSFTREPRFSTGDTDTDRLSLVHIRQQAEESGRFGTMTDLRTLLSRLIVPALLVAAVTMVYGHAFSYPTFNPEHSFHYMLNAGLTGRAWLDHYLTVGDLFYRPTVYFTYYQTLTQLIGWHDIFGFKLFGLALLVVLGLAVHWLGLLLWQGDRLAAGIAALVTVVHPIMFVSVYETTGFDLLYQLLVLAIVAPFVSPALTGPGRWRAAGLCLGLYLVALTTKEQVVALPGFLLLVVVLDRHENKASARWLVLAGTIALTIGYVLFNLPRMGYVDSGEYRTGINFAEILSNIESGPLWLAHLFVTDSQSWPWMTVHNTVPNLLYGFAVVGVVGWYGIRVFRTGDPGERRSALITAAFVASFMAIPIYSGGRSWHYALPLAGFALIQGRATATAIRSLGWGDGRRLLAATALVAALPVTLSGVGFAREMDARLSLFRINTEAMLHPPLAPEIMPHGATVLYATGVNSWMYGLGRLFRFAYLDPSIDEQIVPTLAALTPPLAKAWLAAPHAYYFVYDPDHLPAWADHSAELRARLAAP